MSYTLSHKIGIISTIFFASESRNSSTVDPDKQQKADILKSAPELTAIADKIQPSELYARARILSKLKEMASHREQTFGKVKSTMNTVGVDNAIANLKELIESLSKEANIKTLGDKSITAWFKGWDGPGDTNIAVVSGTNMTYRKFLLNVVNDSQLVASLFVSNEKAPESAESEVFRQRTRLSTFLIALENKNPENEYKNMFRNAHEAIAKGDLDGAKEIARKTIKKEWNIDINSVSDKSGHADALRAIGATHEAGQAVVGSTKELTEKKDKLSEKQNALVSEIKTKFNSEKQNNTAIATSKYEQLLTALPDSDPYKAQVIRGKSQIIDELASEKAYMTILDGYIAKNGSDGLGGLFNMYNDMKGLNGFWNFTDENAKMTKEMAIMVASFALTAGIGPILGGIGVGARAIAGANVVRATTLAADASKFRIGINAVSNGGKALARGALVGTARITEAGVAMNDAAQASRLARIPAEAAKFTTADALIRSATREAGEQSGFHGFAEKLALNGVMFGAFSGMEKFVSGPALSAITKKFGIENAVATFVLNGVVLTAGDIGVMQALHAAETGTFKWDWMSAYQALAFRVGMKGTEKAILTLKEHFPNLSKKWEAKTKKIEKTSETKALEPSSETVSRKEVDPLTQEYQKFESNFSDKLKSDIKKIPGLTVGIRKEGNFIQSTQGAREKIVLSDPSNPTVGISVDANNGIIYLKKQDGSHASLHLETNGSGKFEQKTFGSSGEEIKDSIESIPEKPESPSIDPDTGHSLESKKQTTTVDEVHVSNKTEASPLVQVESEAFSTMMNRVESIPKGTGETTVKLGDKEYTINRHPDGKKLDVVIDGKVITYNSVEEFITAITKEHAKGVESEAFSTMMNRVESIPKGTGETAVKLGDKEYTINRHPDGKKLDVVIDGKVITYNSVEEFITAITKEHAKGVESEAFSTMMNRVESIPKGTGETAVKLGDKEYTINRHPDGKKLDVVIDGKVITYNSVEEFITAITKEHANDIQSSGTVLSHLEGTKTDSRYDENGRLIDPQAKTRIENEHRMNTSPKSAQESADIFSSQSFRKEIESLMSLDDATFQVRYTELMSRGNIRMYEREMMEGAANVRKLTDKQILEKAIGDIAENRQAMGQNRGISESQKALTIAENAALRYRLKDMLSKGDKSGGIIPEGLIPPGGIPPIVTDGPITDPEAFKKAAKEGLDKRWLLLGLLPLLLLLHKCQGDKEPIPLPVNPTAEDVYDACVSCYQGSKSTLDKNRKINGREANDVYRLNVSQRWMQTQSWKDLEKNYSSNKAILPQNSDFIKAMDAILGTGGLTVENVQSLQHCIGMLDGNASQDSKVSQDGMLGRITTRKIAEYITQCKTTAGVTSE